MVAVSRTDQRRPAHAARLTPLDRADWSEAAVAAIGILPPHMQPPPGESINSLSVLARHPKLARAYLEFSLYLRFDASLDDRTRELLILRTAWIRGGGYELARHGRIARRIGFTDDELHRITAGSTADGWTPAEALLLLAVEELCADYTLTDATWAELIATFDEQQVMDVVMTVGAYDMLAMAFNTFGIEPEDDLPPFPPE